MTPDLEIGVKVTPKRGYPVPKILLHFWSYNNSLKITVKVNKSTVCFYATSGKVLSPSTDGLLLSMAPVTITLSSKNGSCYLR